MKIKTLIYFTAALVQFACSAVTAQVLDKTPAFDVGDKWTYEYTNKGDRKASYIFTHQAYKADADSAWLYGETQQPNATRKQYVMRFDYKRADTIERFEYQPTIPNEPGLRFADSLKQDSAVQFPMAVGNKHDVKWVNNDGSGYIEMEVKVESFEKVTVTAGEFDAYRVKYSGWWYNQNGGVTTGSGRASQTRWYAPSAKRIVKWEIADKRANGAPFNETTTELIKWEPKTALPTQFAH
jgi:hypothetical protein